MAVATVVFSYGRMTPSPGGRPWQVPQASYEPSTVVQTGVVRMPPAISVAPWQ